jgi:hypothetical protein
MIGWDVDRTEVPAGEAAWLTYVFEVKSKPPEGWKLFVHVQGPHETLLIYDHVPVNNSYPVKEWQAGEFIIDRNWIRLDPGDRPGTYEVFMGFYDPDNNDERATVSGRGLPYAPTNKVLISELKVSSDKRDFKPEPVGREALPEMLRKHVRKEAVVGLPGPGTVDYNVQFGDCIELYRVELPQGPVVAGQKTVVRYHFKVLEKVPRWSGLFVHLNGPEKKYHNATHTPVAGTYAPDRWQPGDFIEDIHEITVPADYPAGPYQVSMGFWNSAGRLPINGGGERVDQEMRLQIGTLQIVAAAKTAEP